MFIPVLRVACCSSLLALAACSSSDSNTVVDAPLTQSDTDVTVQSGECSVAKLLRAGNANIVAEDVCEVDVVSEQNDIQQLGAGNPITGSLLAGEETLIQVPSGAEIILTSESGDADLFLFDRPELVTDALLCASADFFREENCTATVDNGELYALVFGRTDATYTLSATTDCSVPSVNQWVYRNMLDYYLYADFVPVVNPDSFESTFDLIRDLRFNQLDPFSNVQVAVTQDEFTETGGDFGFGQRWRRDGAGNLRIASVYDDSPFGRAGIQRGDIMVSINGESLNDISNARFFELTGDRDNPVESIWEVIKVDTGVTEFIPITIGEFTANTVLSVNSFTNPAFDGAVGYLAFDGFIRTSENELNAAFNQLASANVSELVLDLRYNPGGLISIAQRLASQIAGPSIAGQTLVTYRYNDKYPQANFDFNGVNATPSLGLDRVIVLTTGNTASASELVISSLRPYMEVITIGERTTGKAFISAPRNFCGVNLNAMEADSVNANGIGVAGGIPADCFAVDDLTRGFGISESGAEGMLGASLDYLLNGTCEATPVIAKQADTSVPPGATNPLPSTVLDLPRP